jgi:hypothetical protein
LSEKRGSARIHIGKPATMQKPPEGTADCALLESGVLEHRCEQRSRGRGDDGKCKRGFAKPVQPLTTIDAHGFPHYKRDARSLHRRLQTCLRLQRRRRLRAPVQLQGLNNEINCPKCKTPVFPISRSTPTTITAQARN